MSKKNGALLKKPHTHAGKHYPAGATLPIDGTSDADISWLIANKIIDDPAANAAPAVANKKENQS